MRIAIVNDMLLAVEALRRVLVSVNGHQVAWIARNGAQAVQLCIQDRPDLILMDLIMPEMDGVEATRRIMAQTPCAIVVVTANVKDHASKVFEAMGAGALDAVNTPVLSNSNDHADAKALLAKIETISRLIAPIATLQAVAAKSPVERPADFKHDRLVAIGASAGGPAALAKILSELPADFPAAVAIVQHVDVQFVPGLAEWLAGQTPLHVRIAEEGDHSEAGTVLIAGKDAHLVLTTSKRWGYMKAKLDCAHRPSVDVFFDSVSKNWKGMTVGVLLTGMGRDGAAGLKMLRMHGHHTIAQDQNTSAVYGMPKAAAELNAATEILALDKISAHLTNIVGGSTRN
jgi:two-component system, chemotaxis family, response regulator WspF